eukprot:7620365-Alexandrium_andersonii.AAC.1
MADSFAPLQICRNQASLRCSAASTGPDCASPARGVAPAGPAPTAEQAASRKKHPSAGRAAGRRAQVHCA